MFPSVISWLWRHFRETGSWVEQYAELGHCTTSTQNRLLIFTARTITAHTHIEEQDQTGVEIFKTEVQMIELQFCSVMSSYLDFIQMLIGQDCGDYPEMWNILSRSRSTHLWRWYCNCMEQNNDWPQNKQCSFPCGIHSDKQVDQ